MTRANVAITSFNAGELSPLLGGRPELQKYQAGLSVCENFIPRVQGALTRRGGTRYVHEVKDSAKRTWLLPFVFSRQDAFVLECGDTYVRFYRDRGVLTLGEAPAAWSGATAYTPGDLVSRDGVNYYCRVGHTNHFPPNITYWWPLEGDTYEVPSPWATSRLDRGGTFAIRYVQSGDVLYLCQGEVPVYKLTRFESTRWAFEAYEPDGGPFQDMNEDQDVLVQVSAVNEGDAADIAVTGGDIFDAGHVGSLFYVQMQDGSDIKPWEVYQPVAVGDVRRSDGKYYECTQVGEQPTYFTGTEKPIHTSGKYWDGDGKDVDDDSKGALGAEWEYLHPGYGWLKITAVTDGQHAHGTVLSRLPQEVQSGTTWRWALGSWSDKDGWPTSACFFRERLTFARGQRLYFSQSGDFANMKAKDFGQQLPSSAFQVLVQSGSGDEIQWLAPTDQLLAGTGGSVHAVNEAATSQAFGPTNAAQKDQNMDAAGLVKPVAPGPVLYADAAGGVVYEAAYAAEVGKYVGTDLNVYADHITAPAITEMAYAKTPHAVIWAATSAGGLIGLTYHKAQGVVGWHRQPIGGDGVVEHIAVIPSPEGERDDLWLIVRRAIDGVSRRYVEFVTPEFQKGDDPKLAGYSDCHLVYDGASAQTVSGLDHLEGCSVQVKADGAAHPDCVVAGGSITLKVEASKVVVGLAADARAQLMPIQAGAQLGTGQGQLKRFHKVWLRMLDCLGGKVGQDFDAMAPIVYRDVAGAMDAAPPLFSGLRAVELPGGFDVDATIALHCQGGFPFTLTALIPEGMTNEG